MFGFSQIQLLGLVVLIVVIGLMGWRIKYLENQNGQLNQDIGEFKQAVKNLEGTLASKDRDIDKQNASIEALKTASDERSAKAATEVSEAKKRASKNESLAQELLARTPNTTDYCSEGDKILNEYLATRKKRNETPTTNADSTIRLTLSRLRFQPSSYNQN